MKRFNSVMEKQLHSMQAKCCLNVLFHNLIWKKKYYNNGVFKVRKVTTIVAL